MPIFSTENLTSAMLYSLAKILAVKVFNSHSKLPLPVSKRVLVPLFSYGNAFDLCVNQCLGEIQLFAQRLAL